MFLPEFTYDLQLGNKLKANHYFLCIVKFVGNRVKLVLGIENCTYFQRKLSSEEEMNEFRFKVTFCLTDTVNQFSICSGIGATKLIS